MKAIICNYLISYLVGKDPERFIRSLIRKYLPNSHLASNPIRKTKRTKGDAIL